MDSFTLDSRLFACHTLFIKFIGSHFILIMFYLADDVFSYRFFADYQLCNRLITSIDHVAIYIGILRKDLLIFVFGCIVLIFV